MSDDIRAATERVRQVRKYESTGMDIFRATVAAYGPSNEREHSVAKDERMVIDAHLAEHPADSGEFVNHDWLMAHGFIWGADADGDKHYTLFDPNIASMAIITVGPIRGCLTYWCELGSNECGNMWPRDIRNRGQVYGLCRELGHPLKEIR